MAVANQVVALRQESERLAKNQVTQGVITVSEQRHASAASYKFQADLPQANLNYLLAVGRASTEHRLIA